MSPDTTSSTRRFCCRPEAVSLDATGIVFPNPLAVTESSGIPDCGQIIPHRRGAVFRKLLIVVVASDAVGVTFHLHPQPGMPSQNSGHSRQLLARCLAQGILGGVEQYVRHIYDQPSRGIARLQDRIELAQ